MRSPGAWAHRQLKLKLNDLLGPLGLRVFDSIGFGALRTGTTFAHVLDVGVAYGTPDLYARCPEAFLDLFEPSPQFYAGLEAGVLASRPSRLHRVALGRADGEADFHLTGPASSSLLGSQPKPGRTFPVIRVPVRRLDSVVSAGDIKRPCLLKIDTEGYELAVLEGADSLLPSIDCVILELHFGKPYAYAPQQVLDLLARCGFALTDMLDREVRDGRIVCCDLVFERPDRAA